MKILHVASFCIVTGLVGGWQAGLGQAQVAPPDFGSQPPAQPGELVAPQDEFAQDDAIDVLARGPVHEAFAEVVTLEPAAGPVIPREPPAPIDELPPEVKPEGDNVVWISGYWQWDDDREDFIWVSGVWRNVPPERQWVPGYWNQAEGGWQWVSGFWANAQTQELTYLSPPPESLEQGPNVDPPAENQFWVPGNWVWSGAQYAWQPGYWTAGYENWTWVPARYCYTPRGVIYVSGYWDYYLPQRGILFAPVYFHRPIYTRPAYYYTPYSVVNLGALTFHLFVSPKRHHYYFGDYYNPRYSQAGLYPWFRYHTSHRGYDPIFAYHHWQHRGRDRDWYRDLENRHRHYQTHEHERPRHSWREQAEHRPGGDRYRHDHLVDRMDRALERGEFAGRVHRIDQQQRERARDFSSHTRQFRQERLQAEVRARLGQTGPDRGPGADRGPGRGSGDADRGPRGSFRLPEQYREAQDRMRELARQGRGPDGDARGPGQGRPDFGQRPGQNRGPEGDRGRPDFGQRPGQQFGQQRGPQAGDARDRLGDAQRRAAEATQRQQQQLGDAQRRAAEATQQQQQRLQQAQDRARQMQQQRGFRGFPGQPGQQPGPRPNVTPGGPTQERPQVDRPRGGPAGPGPAQRGPQSERPRFEPPRTGPTPGAQPSGERRRIDYGPIDPRTLQPRDRGNRPGGPTVQPRGDRPQPAAGPRDRGNRPSGPSIQPRNFDRGPAARPSGGDRPRPEARGGDRGNRGGGDRGNRGGDGRQRGGGQGK